MTDMLDLSTAVIHNSPPDIASWPVTTSITQLMETTPGGLSFEFAAKQQWPEVIPPGWTGGVQYTVWACVKVGGQWHAAGFIQMWKGRPSTGAPLIAEFAKNWAYDAGRWGPMAGYQPTPTEPVGFFVSAGNARGETGVTTVRERSQVVVINPPTGDVGSWAFGDVPTPPPPTPSPVPPPPQPPDNVILDRIDQLTVAVTALATHMMDFKDVLNANTDLDEKDFERLLTQQYVGSIFGVKVVLKPQAGG